MSNWNRALSLDNSKILGIINLSKLPSRQELLAEIIGLVGSSGSLLSQLMGSPGSNIAGTIESIEEKKAA